MKIFLCAVVALASVNAYGQTSCRNGKCYQTVQPSAQSSVRSGKVLRTRSQLPNGTWGPWKSVSGAVKSTVRSSTQSTGLMPGEVNRDSRAYSHAKREAQMLANSGNGGWHPLGVCTQAGCRYSGCGMSSNGRPNHCYLNLGDYRLVARACVVRNGRYYWSAHYR